MIGTLPAAPANVTVALLRSIRSPGGHGLALLDA
jgi:hypothetical protein